MLDKLQNSQIVTSLWSVRAIDAVTNRLNQAQAYLGNSWQRATQVKNTTSQVIDNAITAYVNKLTTQNLTFLQFLQMLNWAVNHPIISLVIVLFFIAMAWSIIKGIIRLIETASWSILKLPLKLLQVLIKAIYLLSPKFINENWHNIPFTNKDNYTSTVISVDTVNLENKYQDKQKRLAEISHRLELIHQEQQQLLQEAANLISSHRGNKE
ncbi:hypothetical protein [Trichormus azollae]|uniref:hypothetical protein n=1 Tax=Trichormus azollae TaxID=1164 RepID=UPI00325FA1B1